MYYPKSKILTNQFTNGNKLVYVRTEQEYVGDYHILSNGKIYTGKNPQDGELKELKISETAKRPDDVGDFSSVTTSDIVSDRPYDTIRRKKQIPSPRLELLEPTYTAPIPQYPSYTRYFLRRTNNAIFTEVSKADYTEIVNQNPRYNWGIYIPFEMPWTLESGRDEEVNRKMVLLTEKRYKVYGFSKFITEYT